MEGAFIIRTNAPQALASEFVYAPEFISFSISRAFL